MIGSVRVNTQVVAVGSMVAIDWDRSNEHASGSSSFNDSKIVGLTQGANGRYCSVRLEQVGQWWQLVRRIFCSIVGESWPTHKKRGRGLVW